jgi:hypothetical protein
VTAPRKKTVRLFTGLTGRPVDNPSPEITEPVTVTGPILSPAELQNQIITHYDNKIKRKRGRPAVSGKAMTAAERKQKSRARLAEASTIAKVNKTYIDEIQTAMHDHRDSAGRLHSESSGGGVVDSILDKLSYKDDGRVKATGCDPQAFERGSYRGVKEIASQWANRQNFYAAAKWDATEKEAYVQRLIDRCCVEEYRCKFGDFVSANPDDVAEHFCVEHAKDIRLSKACPDENQDTEPGQEFEKTLPDDYCVGMFRCLMGDFTSDKYDEVRDHFSRDHKGYIRSMIRYHEPRHVSTPRTFSTRDLPVESNFVTEPTNREENA